MPEDEKIECPMPECKGKIDPAEWMGGPEDARTNGPGCDTCNTLWQTMDVVERLRAALKPESAAPPDTAKIAKETRCRFANWYNDVGEFMPAAMLKDYFDSVFAGQSLAGNAPEMLREEAEGHEQVAKKLRRGDPHRAGYASATAKALREIQAVDKAAKEAETAAPIDKQKLAEAVYDGIDAGTFYHGTTREKYVRMVKAIFDRRPELF